MRLVRFRTGIGTGPEPQRTAPTAGIGTAGTAGTAWTAGTGTSGIAKTARTAGSGTAGTAWNRMEPHPEVVRELRVLAVLVWFLQLLRFRNHIFYAFFEEAHEFV